MPKIFGGRVGKDRRKPLSTIQHVSSHFSCYLFFQVLGGMHQWHESEGVPELGRFDFLHEMFTCLVMISAIGSKFLLIDSSATFTSFSLICFHLSNCEIMCVVYHYWRAI